MGAHSTRAGCDRAHVARRHCCPASTITCASTSADANSDPALTALKLDHYRGLRLGAGFFLSVVSIACARVPGRPTGRHPRASAASVSSTDGRLSCRSHCCQERRRRGLAVFRASEYAHIRPIPAVWFTAVQRRFSGERDAYHDGQHRQDDRDGSLQLGHVAQSMPNR